MVSGNPQSINKKLLIAKSSEPSRAAFDGELSALSEYDLSLLNDLLPFENKDSVQGMTNFGDFPLSIEKNGTHGVIENSNLVFRAIKNLEPLESIEFVDAIDLHLKGVRLTLKSSKDEESLGKQVLCVLDTRQCVGAPASDTAEEKANLSINSSQADPGISGKLKFWDNTRLITSAEHPLEEMGGFKSELDLQEGSRTYLYTSAEGVAVQASAALPQAKIASNPQAGSTELVIHLKDVFNLKTDAEAKAWLYANSTEYAGNYRKFKFVMGNNLYFESGELVITNRLSQKLSADFAQAPGAPKNGAKDLPQVLQPKNARPLQMKSTSETEAKQSVVTAEASQKLSASFFEKQQDTLTAASVEKIKLLLQGLADQSPLISQIEISGQSADLNLSTRRADSIAAALIANGMPKEQVKVLPSLQSAEESVFLVIALKAAGTDAADQAKLNETAKELEEKLQNLFAI